MRRPGKGGAAYRGRSRSSDGPHRAHVGAGCCPTAACYAPCLSLSYKHVGFISRTLDAPSIHFGGYPSRSFCICHFYHKMVMAHALRTSGTARHPWRAHAHPAEALALVPGPTLGSGAQRPCDEPSSVEAGARNRERPDGFPKPYRTGCSLPAKAVVDDSPPREAREHQVPRSCPVSRTREGSGDIFIKRFRCAWNLLSPIP